MENILWQTLLDPARSETHLSMTGGYLKSALYTQNEWRGGFTCGDLNNWVMRFSKGTLCFWFAFPFSIDRHSYTSIVVSIVRNTNVRGWKYSHRCHWRIACAGACQEHLNGYAARHGKCHSATSTRCAWPSLSSETAPDTHEKEILQRDVANSTLSTERISYPK